MTEMFLIMIIIFLVYVLSSIPFGFLIGKYFKHKDLRLLGSQNIGSSNAVRVLGFKYGLFIFILDFLKGFLPIIIFNFLVTDKTTYSQFRIFVGLSAILGHMFSVFNKFRGGKAIATSVGVIISLNPIVGILGILCFVLLVLWKGYASLASLISTLLVNILLYFDCFQQFNLQISVTSIEKQWIFIITVMIFLKHYKNIIYLIKGIENKFK